LTLHNLTFLARLMAQLRGAILDGTLGEVAAWWRASENHPKRGIG
jgi:queuine/archaeosine tRNA-ribosyltransferase